MSALLVLKANETKQTFEGRVKKLKKSEAKEEVLGTFCLNILLGQF